MKSKKELKSKAREIAHSIMKKKGYSKSRAYAIANANVYERVEQALLNSGIVSEEIVNPDNRGTMTKAEIIKRDRIARSRKVKAKIRATKGNDTDENARYRYATFITMMMRGGKKGAAQPGEKRRTKKSKKAKAAAKKITKSKKSKGRA